MEKMKLACLSQVHLRLPVMVDRAELKTGNVVACDRTDCSYRDACGGEAMVTDPIPSDCGGQRYVTPVRVAEVAEAARRSLSVTLRRGRPDI